MGAKSTTGVDPGGTVTAVARVTTFPGPSGFAALTPCRRASSQNAPLKVILCRLNGPFGCEMSCRENISHFYLHIYRAGPLFQGRQSGL